MPHLPPAHHETSKHDSRNETKIKEKQNETVLDSNSNLTESMTHHNQTKELTTWFLILKMAKNINNIKVPAKTMIVLSSHSQEIAFCYVIFYTFCYAWWILLSSISVMVKYQKTYFWIAKAMFYLDFYLLVLNLVLL
jgi:hypothetical protein